MKQWWVVYIDPCGLRFSDYVDGKDFAEAYSKAQQRAEQRGGELIAIMDSEMAAEF